MIKPASIASAITAPHAAQSAPTSAEQASLRKASQGFEAIFVRQMLAAARQTNFGGNDLFGSNPADGGGKDTFTQMRDDRFADIAAQSGAFGLARQLESQLARTLPTAPTTGASTTGAKG